MDFIRGKRYGVFFSAFLVLLLIFGLQFKGNLQKTILFKTLTTLFKDTKQFVMIFSSIKTILSGTQTVLLKNYNLIAFLMGNSKFKLICCNLQRFIQK